LLRPVAPRRHRFGRVSTAGGALAALDALAGEWAAERPGFKTALTYLWLLEGRVLEATNEVHGDDGRVIARYRGMYARDGGRNAIVFWTASERTDHPGE
jgi:hypothetical protein